MHNFTPLERDVQAKAKKKARDLYGVKSVKINAAGERGHPDIMFFIPGGKPFLVEFKREGVPPRRKQIHLHGQLRDLGYDVEVHDTAETALEAVRLRMGVARGAR